MQPAEVHDARGVHKTGFPIEDLALQSIHLVVIGEGVLARIESGEAVVRAQPEITRLVGQNALNYVVRQALVGRVNGEGFVSWIVAQQTVFAGKPEDSVRTLGDEVDLHWRRNGASFA